MRSEQHVHLMAHMVAGYPDRKRCLDVAAGLLAGGAEYLEVQFPYSDPTADGPAIQHACSCSLEAGFRVDDGFELVRSLSDGVPVFIMSYAGVVFARGVERFVSDAAAVGARGLIVPDLMPGHDEGLFELGSAGGLVIVPVVVPGMREERLQEILALKSPFLYAAIRTGITGGRSIVDDSVVNFLTRIRRPETILCAGFGISSALQAIRVQRYTDVVVAGSVFVRAVMDTERSGADLRGSVAERVLGIAGKVESIEEEEKTHRLGDSISG